MGHDHHIYWATTTWFTSSFTHGDHAFEWTTPQRYEHQEPAGITLRETKIRDLSWGLWTSKSPFFDQNNCQFKEKGYSTYQLKWSSKKNGHRKWHTVLTNSRFFLKKKYNSTTKSWHFENIFVPRLEFLHAPDSRHRPSGSQAHIGSNQRERYRLVGDFDAS